MAKSFLEPITIDKISFYKNEIPLPLFEFINKR